MNSKPWYKSKTVWFNIATVGGAVAGGVVGLLPTLQPLLSVEVYGIAMTVVGLINIGLRSVTKDAVWLVDSTKE
jgi:hypothetical protein